MILFITDNWKLDLTNSGVNFVEENDLFYNYFIKNYSLPFSMQLDSTLSLQMGFLDENNISQYQTKYDGVLQKDNTFCPASLQIDSFSSGTLSGTIVYGNQNSVLLKTKLKELPFSVVSTTKLEEHAKEVITKSYPEVGYNFPMVIDRELKAQTNYESFKGVKNYYHNGSYLKNNYVTIEGEQVAANGNILTPMPYILEILKVGFQSVGIEYGGDFISDPLSQKLIWDTGVFLEAMHSPVALFHQLDSPQSSTEVTGGVEEHFFKKIPIHQTGAYSLRMFYRLPTHMRTKEFTVHYNGHLLYKSTLNSIDDNVPLVIPGHIHFGNIEINMIVFRDTSMNHPKDIKPHHFFTLKNTEGTLNVFPNVFTLSDIMPDMKFSTFLNKLKNWLNLEIKFGYNTVTLDYAENKFLETTFLNETHLQAVSYDKSFNKNKAYHLKSLDTNVYVAKNGITENLNEYSPENINVIDTGVYMMPISARNGVYTTSRAKDGDFQVLLYDGLQNGAPVGVTTFNGLFFDLKAIYNRFWKNWLHFRTNSETIKEQFTCSIYDKLTTELGKFKYNKKMLVKKISKKRKDKDNWIVSCECETVG